MVKGKDLQDAKVYKVEFEGKVRPLTFDYNAIGELQELGYDEPFEAIQGLATGNLKSVSALFYVSFVAGQMAEDETEYFELTRSQVARKLGTYMMKDEKHYQDLMAKLGESIASFFPEVEEVKEEKSPKKTKKATGEDSPKN